MNDLLYSGEVQALLGWSRATLYRHVKEGGIPVTRIGGRIRFRRKDIEAWIEANTTQPAPMTAAG